MTGQGADQRLAPRTLQLRVAPLTLARWADLEAVFGGLGGARCWCMAYRRAGAQAPLPGSSRSEAKSMFDRAGFTEVARRKPQQPIVRLVLGQAQPGV